MYIKNIKQMLLPERVQSEILYNNSLLISGQVCLVFCFKSLGYEFTAFFKVEDSLAKNGIETLLLMLLQITCIITVYTHSLQ